MLSINTIARVVVNVVRSAEPTSFDTGLLLVKDTNFTDSKRLKSYASSSRSLARPRRSSRPTDCSTA